MRRGLFGLLNGCRIDGGPMRVWILCFLGLCAVAARADRYIDVSQLVATITDAVAVDRNDERIAQSLRKVHLTERLALETVELLKRMGAGHATAQALEELVSQSAGLAPPAQAPLAAVPAPSDAEQAEMTAKMRCYAAEYIARFPDFIATETVHQYHNYQAVPVVRGSSWAREDKGLVIDGRWHISDSYEAEVAYVAGRENYKKIAAKGKNGQHVDRVSLGEFGGMMEEILDPSRVATFHWDRWQTLGGTRMAVFAYRVPFDTSRYSICCGEARGPDGKAVRAYVKTAHRGLIFVDPRSGAVMRLILYAEGLDAGAPMNAAGLVQEYGEVSIGESRYLLPVLSTAYVRAARFETREEIEYRGHRKFGAEAAIDFGDAAKEKGPR